MRVCPSCERVKLLPEGTAPLGQRVAHGGGRGAAGGPADQAFFLQDAQRAGQHAPADALDGPGYACAAPGASGEGGPAGASLAAAWFPAAGPVMIDGVNTDENPLDEQAAGYAETLPVRLDWWARALRLARAAVPYPGGA